MFQIQICMDPLLICVLDPDSALHSGCGFGAWIPCLTKWFRKPRFAMIDNILFKGTVARDFLPLVFFFKQLLLAPGDKPSNEFDFFRIFAEIFDYFGALPVSTTPAMHALPVSLTPVNNSLPVSTTPVCDTFTV